MFLLLPSEIKRDVARFSSSVTAANLGGSSSGLRTDIHRNNRLWVDTLGRDFAKRVTVTGDVDLKYGCVDDTKPPLPLFQGINSVDMQSEGAAFSLYASLRSKTCCSNGASCCRKMISIVDGKVAIGYHCPRCGQPVCGECVCSCSCFHCGGMPGHLGHLCGYCHMTLCSICAELDASPSFRTCSVCDAEKCSQHYSDYSLCEVCNESWVCSTCAPEQQLCDSCDTMFCGDCSGGGAVRSRCSECCNVSCRSCAEDFHMCTECFESKCKLCADYADYHFCFDCGESKCEGCGDYADYHFCFDCGESKCKKCGDYADYHFCFDCGESKCKKCGDYADYHFCFDCGESKCKKCGDYGDYHICFHCGESKVRQDRTFRHLEEDTSKG
eukprot:g5621.t1